jgi:eukaryotic-like serine/threonine-protein kinase
MRNGGYRNRTVLRSAFIAFLVVVALSACSESSSQPSAAQTPGERPGGSVRWEIPVATGDKSAIPEEDGSAYAATRPLVAEGTVIVGGHHGTLLAVAADTGHTVWAETLGAEILSAPAAEGGVVFVSGERLYALDLASGEPRWSHGADGDLSAPATSKGAVFFGSSEGQQTLLFRLDVGSGDIVWATPVSSSFCTTPLIADDIVYLACDNGSLHALDADTGASRWIFAADAGLFDAPVIAEGTLYMGDSSGRLYAIDAVSGQSIWQDAAGAAVYSSPAVSGQLALFATYQGELHARDSDTGAARWTLPLEALTMAAPVIAEGTAYIGTGNGEFHAIEATEGEVLWTFLSGQGIYGTPTVTSEAVFLYGNDGVLYALSP